MAEEIAEFLSYVEDKKGWIVFGMSEKVDMMSFQLASIQLNYLAGRLIQ